MMQHVSLVTTAFFMGFFPLTDIYVAIPSVMALGLGVTASIFWSSLGSFTSIVIVSNFYERLSRVKKINEYFQKISNSKFARKMKEKSYLFILLTMPIVGSMSIGILGKAVNIDKKRLLVVSSLGIAFYGLAIGVLTEIGIATFF